MDQTPEVPKKPDPATSEHELHPLVKKVLTDVRMLMVGVGGLAIVIWLGGWTAFGQVRTIATDAGAESAKAISEELQRVKAAQVKSDVDNAEIHRVQSAQISSQGEFLRNVERISLENSLNLKLLLLNRGIQPITLDAPPDGGK